MRGSLEVARAHRTYRVRAAGSARVPHPDHRRRPVPGHAEAGRATWVHKSDDTKGGETGSINALAEPIIGGANPLRTRVPSDGLDPTRLETP